MYYSTVDRALDNLRGVRRRREAESLGWEYGYFSIVYRTLFATLDSNKEEPRDFPWIREYQARPKWEIFEADLNRLHQFLSRYWKSWKDTDVNRDVKDLKTELLQQLNVAGINLDSWSSWSNHPSITFNVQPRKKIYERPGHTAGPLEIVAFDPSRLAQFKAALTPPEDYKIEFETDNERVYNTSSAIGYARSPLVDSVDVSVVLERVTKREPRGRGTLKQLHERRLLHENKGQYVPARGIELTHVGTIKGGALGLSSRAIFQADYVYSEPDVYMPIHIEADGSVTVRAATSRDSSRKVPGWKYLGPGYENGKVAKGLDAAAGILFGIDTNPKLEPYQEGDGVKPDNQRDVSAKDFNSPLDMKVAQAIARGIVDKLQKDGIDELHRFYRSVEDEACERKLGPNLMLLLRLAGEQS